MRHGNLLVGMLGRDPLLFLLGSVVGIGIMTVGYLFNALPLQKIVETGLGHM